MQWKRLALRFENFAARFRTTFFLVHVVLTLLIGFVDYITGYEISFSIFYLIPVGACAWILGRKSSLVISALSAFIWFVADILQHPYSNSLIPYWNSLVRFAFFGLVSVLLSALKLELVRSKDQALHDSLTGLANARGLFQFLELEVARTRRTKHPLSLVYVDLDNFKTVNDVHGHQEGDRVLTLISQTVSSNLRQTDLFARIGGDEFVAVLPDTSNESAIKVCQKFQGDVDEIMEEAGMPARLSMGLATFLPPLPEIEEMIRLIDQLMYQAKQNGKGRMIHRVYPQPGNSSLPEIEKHPSRKS